MTRPSNLIRPAQLGVLAAQPAQLRRLIATHAGPLPGVDLRLPHPLAQRLSRANAQPFGTLATRMIDRSLIERVPGPGRAVRHRFTDKGDDLREKAGEIVRETLTESFSALTNEELQTFGDLLARVVAR